MKKTCTKCGIEKQITEFRNKAGSSAFRSMCKKCEKEYDRKREAKKKHEITINPAKFVFDKILTDWVDRNAALPNRGQLRTIKAYTTAGVRNREDDMCLVIGREVERVTRPLYGNPTALIPCA